MAKNTTLYFSVLKALTLLDLVDCTKFEYGTEVKTAKLVLKCLRTELTKRLKESATPIGPTKVATIDKPASNLENETALPFLQSSSTITFDDIIGCDQAKQWLEENIILQFNVEPRIRAKLFQGIRSGVGNVLLYGPPGTGKTLLAQVSTNLAKFIVINICIMY